MPNIRDTALQFERDAPKQVDDSIQASNFGGLNTTASPLNCPYQDSPALLNMDVDVSGNVVKRKGTYQHYYSVEDVRSSTVIPFTTGLGYNFLVAKVGKELRLFEIINDAMSLVMTKANVFNSAAESVQASFVKTSEVEPRLLLATGTNKPVQLKFVEQGKTVTGITTSTTVADPNSRFANATTSNTIVFVNRVRQTGVSLSWAGNVLTINGLTGTTAGTNVIDVCSVFWSWWAEAMRWQGNRYYQITTRNNASIADLSVPIPRFIRSDLDPLVNGNNSFNIVPYSGNTLASSYTNPNDNKPTTNAQYGFSDGGTYVPGAAQTLNPSSLYITFGALSGSTSLPLYWVRRRELRLNANSTVVPTNLAVYVDGKLRTQIYSGGPTTAAQDYYLFSDDGFGNAITINNNTTPAKYLGFEFNGPIGVNYSSYVELVNKEVSHIGTAATANRTPYNDGGFTPIYGIGLYADYKNGFYPREFAFYQGRLTLSNFAHTPLVVVFSEPGDTAVPGSFYSFYQVTDDLEGVADDPFDITIASSPDDYVVTLQEWQGNLFCFTRRSIYRVTGSGQTVLSATSSAVSLVSNMGVVNSRCVAVTETSLIYLGDYGVFDLTPYTVYGEYQVKERSLKIKKEFGLTSNPNYEQLPWMRYDQTSRKLYLGYPEKNEFFTCRKLFVYSTFRESWTEYDTVGAFRSFSATSFVDRALGNKFGMLVGRARNGSVPSTIAFISFEDSRYMDYRVKVVATSTTTEVQNVVPLPVFFTTYAGQRIYRTKFEDNFQEGSFPISPLTNVQDIYVDIGPRRAVFNVDYRKLPNGDIYLMQAPPASQVINILPRRPVTDSEEGRAFYGVTQPTDINIIILYVDNVLRINPLNTTVATPVGAVIEFGLAYPSYYSTPLFNSSSLATTKRLSHVMAFMNNEESAPTYVRQDVNVVDGQQDDFIIDQRKQRLNCSFFIQYSSDSQGDLSYDVYGYGSLVWDDGLFDIAPANLSFEKSQLFKQPIIGSGYGVQFIIYGFDEATFSLGAYQLLTQTKGRRVKTRY